MYICIYIHIEVPHTILEDLASLFLSFFLCLLFLLASSLLVLKSKARNFERKNLASNELLSARDHSLCGLVDEQLRQRAARCA